MTTETILNLSERITIEEKNLARHIDWTGRHDSKSSLVLAIATGMLGFLMSSIPDKVALSSITLVLGFLAIVLLAFSLFFIHLGNYPRTTGPSSLLFFGTVATMEFETYKEKSEILSSEGYYEDLLRQCYVLARIISRKFWALQWAYRTLFLALPPWSICVILFKFSK